MKYKLFAFFSLFVVSIFLYQHPLYVHRDLPFVLIKPNEVSRLSEEIRTLMPHQTMYLHINSMGGLVALSYELVNAIKTSPGKVIGIVEGEADSAAAIILLACDEQVFRAYGSVLIHYPYSLQMTLLGPQKVIADSNDPAIVMILDLFKELLTDKELKEMKDGNDVVLSVSDLKQRISDKKNKGSL